MNKNLVDVVEVNWTAVIGINYFFKILEYE